MALGYSKRKRILDRPLLDFIGTLDCLVCGKPGPNDADHLTTKGSGGSDVVNNCWSLCRMHHTERHTIGLKRLVLKYPHLMGWLKRAGRDDIIEKVSKP